MIAAIYARTAQGSCEEQNAKCKEFIENSKWTVYTIYIDAHTSANSDDRPALQRVLDEAQLHKFDVLVVNGPERLFRDSVKLYKFMEQLNNLGVSVVFV